MITVDQLLPHLQSAANTAAQTFGSLAAGAVVAVEDPSAALPDGAVRLVRGVVIEGGLVVVLALSEAFAGAALEAMGTTEITEAIAPVLHATVAELAMQGDLAVDLSAIDEMINGEPWGPEGTVAHTAGLFLGDADGEQVGNVVYLFVPEGATPAGFGADVDDTPEPQPAAAPAAVAPAAFQDLDESGGDTAAQPLGLLRGVEMRVTAELGRAKLPVSNLLDLGPGSIVELDRAAGTPIDVLVNGTVIAQGEVVVIDEEYGIRITEIVGLDDLR
jgi:flagellar motor switch protein FliN/FliY